MARGFGRSWADGHGCPNLRTELKERLMVDTVAHNDIAHLIDGGATETYDVLGPTIQFLTEPEEDDLWPCVMRGTIPPGVVIPMHSHADPETFYVVAGEVEGLSMSGRDFTWVRIAPGDIFHVPSGARHGFRNQGQARAVMIICSTSKIGRFFRELGKLVPAGAKPAGPPSREAIERFLETSRRYGYWNASPEENARVGISLADA
jgi:mannose-6-phosphate isomerase-like protein (cupin superfamily)